jgi:hypothetical protein
VMKSEDNNQQYGSPLKLNKLSASYNTIGNALLMCEEFGLTYWHGMSGKSSSNIKQAEFQEGVCLISVEILESYLEDLLDRDISNETLFIRRKGILPPLNWFALGGILASLSCGLYAASTGVLLGLSLAVTIFFSSPFVIIWHISPGWGVARRMFFAQIISQEITRRRGGSHIGTVTTPWNEPRHAMGALLESGTKNIATEKSQSNRSINETGNIFFLSSVRKDV